MDEGLLYRFQEENLKHLFIISELKSEVVLLNSKLDNITKCVRMLNNSFKAQDDILQIGNKVGYMECVGFQDK